MSAGIPTVNVASCTMLRRHGVVTEKKPGPREPGLGIGHVRPTQSPSKRDY
jgi:hypothetical protein